MSEIPPTIKCKGILDLYNNGDLEEARRQALAMTLNFPKFDFGWKILGAIFSSQGKKRDSIAAYRRCLELNPDESEAQNNLGVAFQELSRLQDAKTCYYKAIASNPTYLIAYFNLGNTLNELGELEDAELNYRKAVELKPDFVEGHFNLGTVLLSLGKFREAQASMKKVILLSPNYFNAYNELGVILEKLYLYEDAEKNYKKAIKLQPSFFEAYNNLGVTLQKLGKLPEAEKTFNEAIKLSSKSYEAYNNLGVTQQKTGKFQEAKESFNIAIKLNPKYVKAHRNIAKLKLFKQKDDQFIQMLDLYNDKNCSLEDRCIISFAIAGAYENLGDYKAAYEYYHSGNKMRKRSLKYDFSQDIIRFKQLKDTYPRISQNEIENDQWSENLIPVFIVGMPRSGTTLVEQIISSHSKVTGAGELHFAAKYGSLLARGLNQVDKSEILTFRQNYLRALKSISNDNLVVTDKMPHNFLYLGLITSALPNAKIIHVKRNSAAVCWANFTQYFSANALGYSYSLKDIVRFYNHYRDLMKFWEHHFSEKIYELDYEKLTSAQEIEIRKLINHLELKWEENCLSPHQNKRSVATASNTQIRQKIYQDSSKKWKKFQPFIEKIFDNLYK